MENANYVRIYADENGESRFEDLETELIFMDLAPPAAPLAVAPFVPATTIQWLGAPVGWEGDLPHPVPTKSVFGDFPPCWWASPSWRTLMRRWRRWTCLPCPMESLKSWTRCTTPTLECFNPFGEAKG